MYCTGNNSTCATHQTKNARPKSPDWYCYRNAFIKAVIIISEYYHARVSERTHREGFRKGILPQDEVGLFVSVFDGVSSETSDPESSSDSGSIVDQRTPRCNIFVGVFDL